MAPTGDISFGTNHFQCYRRSNSEDRFSRLAIAATGWVRGARPAAVITHTEQPIGRNYSILKHL